MEEVQELSLSIIEPTPVEAEIVAPAVGFDKVTDNVSVDSEIVSSIVPTVTVPDVWPAANERVPAPAVKSLPDVAVPPAVAQSTLAGAAVLPDRTTANTRLPPSVVDALPIENEDASLSRIVPVPVAVVIDAPLVAPDRFTDMVSVDSTTVSSIVATVTVATVCPAAKVSVPDPVVKSAPAVAVPLAVAQFTLTAPLVSPDRVTVNTRFPPSVTEALLIASVGTGGRVTA